MWSHVSTFSVIDTRCPISCRKNMRDYIIPVLKLTSIAARSTIVFSHTRDAVCVAFKTMIFLSFSSTQARISMNGTHHWDLQKLTGSCLKVYVLCRPDPRINLTCDPLRNDGNFSVKRFYTTIVLKRN